MGDKAKPVVRSTVMRMSATLSVEVVSDADPVVAQEVAEGFAKMVFRDEYQNWDVTVTRCALGKDDRVAHGFEFNIIKE